MRLTYCSSARDKRRLTKFSTEIYRGDPCAVCTSDFVYRDVLFQKTQFARNCEIYPVAVVKDGVTLASCIYILQPRLNRVQVAFFQAREGVRAAVDMLLDEAVRIARTRGMDGVVVGLNGHISYGVGILTDGFSYKNSFDSLYNPPYYAAYFRARGYTEKGLSTYRARYGSALQLPQSAQSGIVVRSADLRRSREEMELMRTLCDRTIANTALYTPTDAMHFYELTKALQPFLQPENLLFAEVDGKTVGFLFWHPDFNQMLPSGKSLSLVGIGLRWLTGKKFVTNCKLNAIGVLSGYERATYALLSRFDTLTRSRYETVETNFVWDDNAPSVRLNQRLLGAPHRRYAVFMKDVRS